MIDVIFVLSAEVRESKDSGTQCVKNRVNERQELLTTGGLKTAVDLIGFSKP